MKPQKFLQSLTQRLSQKLSQKLSQWQRCYKALSRKGKLLCLLVIPNSKNYNQKLYRTLLKNLFQHLSPIGFQTGQQVSKNPPPSIIKSNLIRWVHKQRSKVILVLALLAFTGVIGYKLYNQPELRVGTLAPQTFIAPLTASIQNQEQTEAQLKAIKANPLPILMIDVLANAQINEHLKQLLDDGNEIRRNIGPFPFVDTSGLSILTQQYLRSCSDQEWKQLLISLEKWKKQSFKSKSSKLALTSITKPATFGAAKISLTNVDFNQTLTELAAYRQATSEQNLASLLAQILQARQKYAQTLKKLATMGVEESRKIYTQTAFWELSDDNWVKTQIGIHQSAERILTQGIPSGLPPSILETAVNLQVQNSVPNEATTLAAKLLLAVLHTNLKPDEEQMRQYVEKASAEVAPVVKEVRKGEVIVNKGNKITAWQFDVLDFYHLIHRQVNWLGLTGLMGVISAGIRIFIWVEGKSKSRLRQRDRLLVFLLALSTPTILAMGIPLTNWSAIGLLLGSFYGPTLSITVIGLLALIIPIGIDVPKIGLIAGVVGGILSSFVAQRLRSREELALLGVVTSLTQGGIYLLLKVLIGAAFANIWYITLQETALFALSGLVWSILALGLSPYLEKLFDLITPIRLAELANPNRPLLKRLANETPGTFQHTLFVATLAEAAAKKLGCNVELVRAGTLYHDIGKMHDPLGFIENQMGGPNKHDTEIKNPWKSAEIIKKHVTEGLVMARKHSLPTAIQAFIPEHQGTMAIAYFYHQAQQMAQEDPNIIVDEIDFRYTGPIPQSKETGIVMLADSCEAALRSVKDVTTEQALSMLNNILRAKWEDNQMVDSGLTRAEMSQIAHIFTEVWQQFHHKRIAYPKLKVGN